MKQQGFLTRYPELPFVLLAWAPVAVLVAVLRNADLPLEPFLILGSWTPNLAAFVVLGLVMRQKGGIRALLRGWTKWRVSVRWYLAALSPLLIALLTAVVFVGTGRSPTKPTQPVGPALLLLLLLSLVTGAAGEELGWRGFLLPRLQGRFSALVSSLMVGAVWVLWHLPLWFVPGQGWEAIPFWAFGLVGIASSVLFTFVLNHTEGSLLMASILHLSMNFGLGAIGIMGWLPSLGEGWTVAAVLYAAYAVIVLAAGGQGLSRSSREAPAPGDRVRLQSG